MIVKISPAMRLSYERWIAPKLSKRQKRLIRELALDIGKRLGVRVPNAPRQPRRDSGVGLNADVGGKVE